MTPEAREVAIRAAVDALVTALVAATEPDPASDAPDRLYSILEAAELLGIGRTALYGEIRAGRVRTLKVGRRRLVPSGAIRELADPTGST